MTGTLSYDGKDRVPRKKVTVVCVGRRPVVVAQFTPGYVAASPDAAAAAQFRPKIARK